jgi:hypothetical protein
MALDPDFRQDDVKGGSLAGRRRKEKTLPRPFPFLLSSDRVAAPAAYRGRVSKHGVPRPNLSFDTPSRYAAFGDYSTATRDERGGERTVHGANARTVILTKVGIED